MGQLCSSCVTGCQLGAEGPKKRFWFNMIKQKMFQREMTFLGQSSMLVPLILCPDLQTLPRQVERCSISYTQALSHCFGCLTLQSVSDA